jgi:hypothetical protein
MPVERNSVEVSLRNRGQTAPILPTPRQFRRFLSYYEPDHETHFQDSRDGFGAGSRSLGQGLLHRHACPLTTWGGRFLYAADSHVTTILELTRYPSWSELVPIVCAGPTGSFRSLSPRSCSEASLFCGYSQF